MKSIRKLAFGAALTLSALNSSPSLAQEAAGTFKLAHEVHWQNAVVPAGTYRFTTQSSGPAEMLTLHNIDGDRATYMMMVVDTEESHPLDHSQLVVVSRPTGQFVTTMQLPDFGMTLRFSAPPELRAAAREVARTGMVATTTASGIR
ncbi:MAG: hypothetical protein WBX38_03025 [Candidatus Sulfotelmatobacter sp.]